MPAWVEDLKKSLENKIKKGHDDLHKKLKKIKKGHDDLHKKLESMDKKLTHMEKDLAIVSHVEGKTFEQHLYKHAGKTLGTLSAAYKKLEFTTLNQDGLALQQYLLAIFRTKQGHFAPNADAIDFSWLTHYQHTNFKGKMVPLADYNFNLVTEHKYNTPVEVLVGEVKVQIHLRTECSNSTSFFPSYN